MLGPVQQGENHRKSASLIVNLDAPTEKGELSYAAQAGVECDTGRLTLERVESFTGPNQTGDRVQSASLAQWMAVPESDTGLHYASLIVCLGWEEALSVASKRKSRQMPQLETTSSLEERSRIDDVAPGVPERAQESTPNFGFRFTEGKTRNEAQRIDCWRGNNWALPQCR